MNADDINRLGVKLEEVKIELEDLDIMCQDTADTMTMMALIEALDRIQELEGVVREVTNDYDEFLYGRSDAGQQPLTDYALKHGE